jgi:hypothetical protein
MRLRGINVISLALLNLVLLAGCGGGGDSSAAPPQAPSSVAAITLSSGQSYKMKAGVDVLVPPGTVILGDTVDISVTGTSNTFYTTEGTTISVPTANTGLANNRISTSPAPAGAITTTVPLPTITLIAGDPNSHYLVDPQKDGSGTAAVISSPGHIKIDPNGNLIFSDNGVLRKVTQAGVVTTLYKDPTWAVDGIAVDGTGNIFESFLTAKSVPDPQGNPLVQITTYGGTIRMTNTSGTSYDFASNWISGSSYAFTASGDLVVDSHGNIFLANTWNNKIVKFTPNGVMSVFAGSGTKGVADGQGIMASLTTPANLAIDANDNLFFCDTINKTVRKVSPDGTVTTIAVAAQADGQRVGVVPSNIYPTGPIAVNSAGNIYFQDDYGNFSRIDSRGFIITYKIKTFTDNFIQISSMTTDTKGNLFVTGSGYASQIWKLSF